MDKQKSNMQTATVDDGRPMAVDERNSQKPDRNKRSRLIFIGLIVLLAMVAGIVIGVVLGTSSSGGNDSSSSSSSGNREATPSPSPTAPPTNGESSTNNSDCRRLINEDLLSLSFDENDVRRLQTDALFLGTGCFRVQDSTDSHTVSGTTLEERAEACSERCLTRHFGVSESNCFCYVEAPLDRLAIGGCDGVACDDSLKMEAYFRTGFDAKCNQDTTSSVRNFLVEEDDAPFGYDIIRNEFRTSPFELYKDECGTNIYEVQTEISEGSRELQTSVQEIKEFAKERRSSLSRSVSTSASAGYDGKIAKASTTVSASFDSEQSAMFQSSGANEFGSKVYTSLGVKRIAEVKLVDFDNKRHFVTFSPQFGGLLRSYKDNEFANETAREIFDTYGMFVMTRGIFGGFMRLRTTATQRAVSSYFASEEESRKCYEAAVSGEASGFGFSASFDVGTGQCTEQAASEMQSLQNSYASETSEQVVVGGTTAGGEFTVPPELSTLLTTKDKYPPNDPGIELRLLSDFLAPEKVSPLEVKRYLLTESDFAEIQENLQIQQLAELQRYEEVIQSGCGEECEVPYLTQTNDDGFECTCYDPQPPPVAELAGTYEWQLLVGGDSGNWGNSGSGVMTITEFGEIFFDGVLVTEYQYDESTKRLQWDRPGDLNSSVNILFFEQNSSTYYFGDQPNDRCENCFTGSLRYGSGPLDFRAFLQDD